MASFLDRVDAHLKHRLNPKTIVKEVFAHFTDKVVPHGADEIGNSLYGGSGYLPWPAHGGPKPIEAPPLEEVPPEPSSFDRHAALYGTTYDNQLDQAARRGQDPDRGMTR